MTEPLSLDQTAIKDVIEFLRQHDGHPIMILAGASCECDTESPAHNTRMMTNIPPDEANDFMLQYLLYQKLSSTIITEKK